MGQACRKSESAKAESNQNALSVTENCSDASAPTASDNISAKLALGAGCYWGTEKYVKKNFQQKFPKSIKTARVGFMNPDKNPKIKNPSYEEVCTGKTGHVEVLLVELNNPKEHFEELIRFFFTFHDPTTTDRQGNDHGTQYASYVFCSDEEQIQMSKRVMAELQGFIDDGIVEGFTNGEVVTKIGPYTEFTEAQREHQEYLSKNPNGYCNHFIRLKEWPSDPAGK